jgi:hypothetical protein
VGQVASEVADVLSDTAVRALARAAASPEGRVPRHLPAASERLVCRTLNANRNAIRHRPRPNAPAAEVRRRAIALKLSLPTQGHRKILIKMRKLSYSVHLIKVRKIPRLAALQLSSPRPGVLRREPTTSMRSEKATRPN